MLKEESTPWQKAVVMVCTKCCKLIKESDLQESGNCGENLKSYLKSELKQAGRGGDIRVVTSSCLNVCEADFQAVVYSPVTGAGGETKTWILHPEKDRKELLQWLSTRG